MKANGKGQKTVKRLILALGFVATTQIVFASAGSGDQGKVDAIWDVANVRINRQVEQWFGDGDYPRTTQLLRFQYGVFPNDYDIATNLGWLLESSGRDQEALAIYINYRRNNPKDPDAALPEATFYFQKRVYAKVLPLLEPALKANPHPNVWRMLAHSYEKMNLYADSKRVWLKYLAKVPNDATAKQNLARVEQKLRVQAAKPKSA